VDYRLIHGDCLEVLPTLEAGSVDAVITDPPYGTTACKWDSVIPFDPMWAGIKHVIKRNAAVVLFGSQPFTSALVMSNPKWFKYEWIWDKVNLFTNQMNAKQRPMRQHENAAVFYQEVPTYNPQWRQGKPYKTQRKGLIEVFTVTRRNGENLTGLMYPGTVLSVPGRLPNEQGLHPTQKPVALLEYLIRTYTNEGETVLDFTMGSGSTGVACLNTGRRFIGIEKDAAYFAIAEQRLAQAAQQTRLAV
jgi:site-specific DNA-methyltransferase (adenine-specific)